MLILDGSNNATYSLSVTGSTQFAGVLIKQGSGIWALDEDVNQRLTVITDGFINFNSLTVFGTGNITLNGGGLQWASGYTGDVSGLLNPLGQYGGILDANGNTGITLASVISGTGGPLEFANSNTSSPASFILTATNTYEGGTIVGGTVPGADPRPREQSRCNRRRHGHDLQSCGVAGDFRLRNVWQYRREFRLLQD